jgi:hypothetical protein
MLLVLVALTVAFVVGVDSCDGSADAPETPADVLERGGSIAQVTIAGHEYDFEVSCYDAGAGSVVAVGTGTEYDPASGSTRASRVFVQGFLGDPYIGVTLAAPEGADPATARDDVYEAALDESFDLLLEDGVIAVDGIEFVRNLDLTSGAGESVGQGSLRVTCNDFEPGVPPQLER